MSDPSEADIQHGLSLLREAHDAAPWNGPFAAVVIDPVCRWRMGGDTSRPCNRLLEQVVLLPYDAGIHALALCKEHADCMKAAVERWRSFQ